MQRVGLDRLKNRTQRAQRLRGVHLAVVTANTEQGKDSRYRVKVKFPWLPEGDESYWARILAPMAGPTRGTYFLPEIDDQVLVVFELGEISRPIIVGGLWSTSQKPPQKNADGKNNIKVIKSKSGHRLIFDDTAGAEKIVIVDKTKKNKIVLDTAKDSLTIQSAGDIEILAPSGAIKISGKTVKLNAAGAMSGGGKSVNITGASLNAAATGVMTMGGGAVALNPPGMGAPAGVARTGAAVAAALDQVREVVRQTRAGGPGADSTAPGGSAAARQDAAGAHLPDTAETPTAPVGASASAAEVTPGQPVTVQAPVAGGGTAAGAGAAHYEVEDADTGQVIDRGPATVSGGRATATWDSRSLDKHPDTQNVNVRMHAGGGSTSTGTLPVAGRSGGPGAPSPSNRLTDPRQPMPAADHRAVAGGGVTGGASVDRRAGGPITAAPTVDHRGRAQDAPAVDHTRAGGGLAGGGAVDHRGVTGGGAGAVDHRGVAGGAAPGGAVDHRGVAGGGAGSVQDHRAVTGGAEGQVTDHRAGAQARSVASGDTGSAQGAVGGGGSGDVKVGSAASAAIDGDGAAATGAVAGAQVGGAVAGDAGQAAGGGAQGELAEGNVRGAAAMGGGEAGARGARINSTDDVEGEVEGESVREGKERTGVAEGERDVAQGEADVRNKKRDVEYQADVEGRARSEANYEKSQAMSEKYRAEREVSDVKAQGDVEARADHEVGMKKGEVKAEQYHAEREVRQPEYEAEGAKYQVESRTADARDPERAAERESDRRESQGRSESGGNELERNKDDIERGSSDPRGASRHRVKKLDDDK